MTDDYVSRREFDALAARVSTMDAQGTRGIPPLAVQVAEVIKDVAELKHEVERRFNTHEKQHEKDTERRASNRRWLVAAIIAAVAAVDGPVVTIVLARGR